MYIRFFGGRLRVSLLFFPVCALLVWHCGAAASLCFFAAFVLHEGAHALAARAVGLGIESVELLPFGCAANFGGFFTSGSKETAVALAGPLINIAAACAAGVMFSEGELAGLFRQANIGLAAVNMLPALPLDGGRAFAAALGLFVKKRTAAKTAAVAGIALGLAGEALFIFLLIKGELQLSLAVFSAFITASAVNNLRNSGCEFARTTVCKRRAIKKRPSIDVKHIAAGQDRSISEIISGFDPGKYNIVHVIGSDMRTVKTVDEADVLSRMIKNGPDSSLME